MQPGNKGYIAKIPNDLHVPVVQYKRVKFDNPPINDFYLKCLKPIVTISDIFPWKWKHILIQEIITRRHMFYIDNYGNIQQKNKNIG